MSPKLSTPNDYLAPGFPGQSRVLADLYYNRHRDYDPSTGRYIQADPIGLDGGTNLYAYVGGNPVNFIDPDGRNALALAPLIGGGAAEGGGILAACANPVGIWICGGAAIAGIGYGGYLIYKHYNPECPPPVLEMAKGGKQNKRNEYNWLALQENPGDPCDFLDELYKNTPPGREREKIDQARKAAGCKWNSTKK